MSNPTVPTEAQLDRFLHLDVFNRLLQETGDYAIYTASPSLDDYHTVTVGNCSYHRLPDGTMEISLSCNGTSDSNSVFLHNEDRLAGKIRSKHVGYQWESDIQTLEDKIRKLLRDFVGISNHVPQGMPIENALRNILNSEQMVEKVTQTATSVQTSAAKIQPRNVHAIINKAIWSMMGQENIQLALAAAGAHADWREFNFCVRNRAAVQEAMQINPNAVVAWFASKKDNKWRNTQLPQTADAVQIISEAQEWFIRTTGGIIQHAQHYGPSELGPLTNSAQDVWETFSRISIRALRAFPPIMQSYQTLAIAAAEAEAIPSYTVVSAYMRHPNATFRHVPWYFLRAIIRESQKPAKGRTQAELAAKLKEISRNRFPDEMARWEDLAETNPTAPWDQWMQCAPAEVRAAKPEKAKPKYWRDNPDPTGDQARRDLWHQNLSGIMDYLTGDGLEAAQAALHGALTLYEDQWGQTITLRRRGHAQPLLRVNKRPSGTIEITGNGELWTGQINFNTSPDAGRISNLTTGGIAAQTAVDAIRHVLQENGKIPEGLKPKVLQNLLSTTTRRFLATQPQSVAESLSDTALTQRINDALHRMIDPSALNHAVQLHREHDLLNFQKMPLAIYNFAATGADHLTDLTATNPGAVAWLLRGQDLDQLQEVNHPGQIITAAKHSMAAHGLWKQAWKTAAATDNDITRWIIDNCGYRALATAFNALSQIPQDRHNARLLALKDSAPVWSIKQQKTNQFPETVNHNIQKMIILAVKDGTVSTTYRSNFIQTLDYVESLSLAGITLRSTTWDGLQKAQEAWHRRLRQTQMAHSWQNIVADNCGAYHCWNSLVPTIEHGDFTLDPLTTEFDLYLESNDMRHCVISYGSSCAGGNSRIFRIQEGGKHIGTGEIQMISDKWTATQVRGILNNRISPEAEEAMQHAAEAYNKAWKTAGGSKGRKHTSWTLKITDNPEALAALQLAGA